MRLKTILILFVFFFAALSANAATINSHVVLKRSFEQNPQAKSIKLDRKISIEDLREAKSQYDTSIIGEFSYEKDLSERSVTFLGTDTSTTNYNFGISQLIPTGTELLLGFYNTKSTSDSAFAAANTLYDSRYYFSVSQPILNNFLGFQNRHTVKLAKQGIKTVASSTNLQLQTLAYQNLQYYWSWYLYTKLNSISHTALEAASRLYRTNKQKMEIGLIEKPDIYAFAANVDIKRAELLEVQANRASVESQLRVAINIPHEKLSLGKESTRLSSLPSVSSMIEQAKKTNPEYLTAKNNLKTQDIVVAMKKNSRLPQLDLVASLTLNGIDPSYSTAHSDIYDNHPIWTGGVSLTYPLQNRQARANFNKEKLKQAQALFGLQNTENKLITEIDQGYKKYLKAKSRMHVIATAVKHQKLKWEGEIKKYDQGRSDPDMVIRYQNDYLDTEKLYVQAQVDYFLARLALDVNRGVLVP